MTIKMSICLDSCSKLCHKDKKCKNINKSIYIIGQTGAPGNNTTMSSVFSWSSILQKNLNVTYFQYVTFENPLIGPLLSGWSTITEIGYTSPTTFIVPMTGYYLITYKLDIRSGASNQPSFSNSATVLTNNGIEISGSTTLVEAPEANHIYTISNTVLCNLTIQDHVSLLFWSDDIDAQIGEPATITGLLPSNLVPNEAVASIVFSRIT